MADNPFQALLNPNGGRTGLFDLRMMSAANRAESPFMSHSHMYGHQGVSGNPMLANLMGASGESDYSQYTFDPTAHAAASQALSPYGLAPLEANQVKQNVVLPNTGFFGNHPRLSGALEGGMFGAMAAHGGATVGDSIQGALEGAIGGQRIRQGMYRQQFARPFEAAGMLEGMQDMKGKRDLQDAEIQHLRAENQKLGRPDHDFRAFGVSRNDPDIATIDNTTGEVKLTTNPLYDPSAARTGNSPEQQFFDSKRAEFKARGAEPTSKDIGNWQSEWTSKHVPPEHAPHSLVAIKNPDGSITYKEAKPGVTFAKGTVPETPSQMGAEPGKAKAARENWIKTQVAKPGPLWMSAGVTPGDPQAAQKLGKFYDENIVPALPSTSEGASGGTYYDPSTGQLENR